MPNPTEVSAVIVTRGNVDLTPVLESLVFEDVVVWDNSRERRDEMTYGLVPAVERAKHQVIYSQDDDIIHSPENQLAILDAYEPGVLTGCMWREWSDGARAQGIPGGYDDLVFYGSGAVYERWMPEEAAHRYLRLYPEDEFFRLWFSCIFGAVSVTKHLDVRFEALPCAEDENRMCNLPDAVMLKTKAIWRARGIRLEVAA